MRLLALIRFVALGVVVLLTCGMSVAAQSDGQQEKKQPVQQTTPAKSTQDANPFPGESADAPVLPTTDVPIAKSEEAVGEAVRTVPAVDVDPVKTPEDAMNAEPTGVDALESSSSSGIRDSSGDADGSENPSGRKLSHKLMKAEAPPHVESVAEDLEVGSLYLDEKNWKAALSRFESARVLDPENPDAFFGLAEAERRLGFNDKAIENYKKVVEYDPESRHAKVARKALKELGVTK